MDKSIKEYEILFLQHYIKYYNVAYIKINHNNGLIPTKVTLYNKNKRVVKHQPTYYGVTVKSMFAWLDENKIYAVNDILINGSDI